MERSSSPPAVDYSGDPRTILETQGAHIATAPPFGCILTLPATGSEMNSSAVVTRAEPPAKLPIFSPFIFPRFSILDPAKTYSLSTQQIANGIADAFVHITEQYLTFPGQGMVQERFAEGLLQTLIEIAPQTPPQPQLRGAHPSWPKARATWSLMRRHRSLQGKSGRASKSETSPCNETHTL